jgi:hypothetical protein
MDERTQARIAALEEELSRLKHELGEGTDTRPAPLTADRRGMVKLLAAGAVGAVTGAAVLAAKPAAALDGQPVLLGQANPSTLATQITAATEDGLRLTGGSNGYGVVADGNYGNAWFPGSGLDPLGTTGDIGALWVDQDGNWWAATVNGSDGNWRKLAGPGSAGQLHILPTPVRVYDSRPNLPPTAVQPKTPTTGNTPRTIDTTANGSNVPLTATAVLLTLTIAAPSAAGFASVWPSGGFPGTSSINFGAGQNIATTTVSGCGPSATVQVLSNVSTDFLVDVIGYYQ